MSRLVPLALMAAVLGAPLVTAQDSRPASRPAEPEPAAAPRGEPAGPALAKALAAARAQKLLESRLLRERIYLSESRGKLMLAHTRGTLEQGGELVIELQLERLDRARRETMLFRYGLSAQNELAWLEATTTDYELDGSVKRSKKLRGEVAGGVLTTVYTRDGKQRPAQAQPFQADTLPMFLSAFLLPALGDLLPAELSGQRLAEVSLSSDFRYRGPAGFARKEKKTVDGAELQRYLLECESDPMEVWVHASGPEAGRIARVVVDYEKDSPDQGFRALSGAELEQLEKHPELLRNEGRTLSALNTLRFGQQRAKEDKGAYQPDLASLELGQWTLEEAAPGYEVFLKISPDGQRWLAIAIPVEPGKTGRRSFCVGTDGKVYWSLKEIPSDESCETPKGLTELR